MCRFSTDVIPQRLDQIFEWLAQHGVAPGGAPFMRYHVIDMSALMDVELGVPVAQAIEGDEQVAAGVMPAGRYASLVYTDPATGIAANKALLDCGAQQGLSWDTWQTEVAIRLAE